MNTTTMRRGLARLTMLGCASLLAACGGMATRTTEVVSSYAIYDVAPAAGTSPAQIGNAIRDGLRKQMSQVNITTGIPPSPLPATPGRFQLVNPLKNSTLAALAGAQAGFPTCDGALVTAVSQDRAMAAYGENTLFFLCLLPYANGYHVDFYVSFTRQSGGFDAKTLGATLMRPLTGDSSQFIPRAIDSVMKSIEATGAKTRLVEQYP